MSTANTEIKLVNAEGREVGSREVPASVFGAKVRTSVLHQTVRWQRAKKRAGTHSVKTRAEVTGGGAKPWRQKGTGRARAGSNTSPLWVGGGVAHGPKPHSYEFSVNKKERKQALCGAISARREEGKLVAIQDLALSEAKTREAARVLSAVGIEKGRSALVIIPQGSEVLEQSFRNIDGVKVTFASGINVYDVLNKEYLVFVGDALEAVLARLQA